MIISPDDKFVVSTTQSKKHMIRNIWDTSTGKCLQTIKEDTKYSFFDDNIDLTRTDKITKDGKLLCLSFTDTEMIKVIDLMSGDVLHTFQSCQYTSGIVSLHPSQLYVAIGTNRTVLISGDTSKHFHIWNVQTGRIASSSESENTNGPYWDLKLFGRDSIFIAAAKKNESFVSLSYCGSVGDPLESPVLVRRLSGHNQPIRQILITSDELKILTAAEDNTVKIWHLEKTIKDFHSAYTDKQLDSHSSSHSLPPLEEDEDSLSETSCLALSR